MALLLSHLYCSKYLPSAHLRHISCLISRVRCQRNDEMIQIACYRKYSSRHRRVAKAVTHDFLHYRPTKAEFTLRLFSCSARRATSIDPKQDSRRHKLLLLTYLSGFIGICLLSAIGIRQYAAFVHRAQGIEDLRIKEYGRRPQLFRYRGYVFPDFVINDIRSIHQFEVREDDIWVVSFPKAGTTWVQEIVYLVSTDGNFRKASETSIEERFPYFEWIFPGKRAIDKMPSPRLIKSHLPLSMLPNEMSQRRPKIIYIARNPKDSVVSFYFFATKFLSEVDHVFTGTFDDFCRLFLEDLVGYGPWWKHVKEAWDRRDEDNILVLFYEDLQMDLRQAVSDIALFLNKSLTDAQIDGIVQHCTFESMKKNKATNYEWLKEGGIAKADQSFMRNGKVGDWKNHLSEDIIKKMNEMVATKLEPAGVPIKDILPQES